MIRGILYVCQTCLEIKFEEKKDKVIESKNYLCAKDNCQMLPIVLSNEMLREIVRKT